MTNNELLKGSRLSPGDMVIQGVVASILDFVSDPDHEKWKRQAQEMDAREGAALDVCMSRYIIDLTQAQSTYFPQLSKQNHWTTLVQTVGEESFINLINHLRVRERLSSGRPAELLSHILETLEQNLMRHF